MGKSDFNQRRFVSRGHLHDNLEAGNPFDQLDGADLLFEQLACERQILLRHIDQHLELLVGVAADCAEHGAGFDALHVPRRGNDDGLDVFDDVAGAFHRDVFRQTAQNAARLGRGVGDGDGLGAAQRGNDFLAEDRQIFIVNVLIHRMSLQSKL